MITGTIQHSTLVSSATERDPEVWRHAGRIFLAFLAIYMLTWGGHYTSGDGAEKVQYAKAMWFNHTANINPGSGVQFSRYGIGHPLLAIPFLAVADVVKRLTGIRCESVAYTFLFVLNGAIFIWLCALYLLPQYGIRRTWVTAAMLGLGTIWWPYTKLDFSEPLVLNCIFGGFLLLRANSVFLGALVAGFSLAIRPDASLQVGILIIWYVWFHGGPRISRIGLVVLGLLPALTLTAYSNFVRWGTILHAGYPGETFSVPILVGMHGILFSGGKSIFLFSPPLVLGIAGFRRFIQASSGRRDGWFFGISFLSQVILFSRWWDWSGDDGWGVRFVVPGVLLMCIPSVEMLSERWLCGAIGIVGVAVQMLAVLISGLEYDLTVRRYNLFRESLYVGGIDRIDFEDLRFNPRYGQIAGHLALIERNLGVVPSPVSPRTIAQIGTPLGIALEKAKVQPVAWDFIWLRRPVARATKLPTN